MQTDPELQTRYFQAAAVVRRQIYRSEASTLYREFRYEVPHLDQYIRTRPYWKMHSLNKRLYVKVAGVLKDKTFFFITTRKMSNAHSKLSTTSS